MTITVPSYLITLPARNEESRLVSAVQRVDGLLQQLGYPYTLLIAEDGSTDNTFKVAKGLTSSYPNLKIVHSNSKLGRGRALRNAWKSTSADVYVFMDADLATDLRFLPKLVSRMQSERLDFVTGSRYSLGSSNSLSDKDLRSPMWVQSVQQKSCNDRLTTDSREWLGLGHGGHSLPEEPGLEDG